MKWIGGMPIDRGSAKNTVEYSIEKFNEKENLVIAIAPDGTRKKSGSWKTGFYYIASGARIPIVMGFTDYATKTGGIGGVIMPNGDIEKDMQAIRKFYLSVTGKYADNASTIDVAQHNLIP
jgi:spore germination protein YaaH